MKRTRFLLMLTLVTTALISHGESRAAAADFTIFLPYVAMNSSLGSLSRSSSRVSTSHARW